MQKRSDVDWKQMFTRFNIIHRPCRDCGALGYIHLGDDEDGWPKTAPCKPCDGRGTFKLTADELEAQGVPREWPTVLTHQQKLHALAARFYTGARWNWRDPQAGDLYTTSRADLELYEVVSVQDGIVTTRYRFDPTSDTVATWAVDDFLSDQSFGRNRVYVPKWVFL